MYTTVYVGLAYIAEPDMGRFSVTQPELSITRPEHVLIDQFSFGKFYNYIKAFGIEVLITGNDF
jgi:hypothetical protein